MLLLFLFKWSLYRFLHFGEIDLCVVEVWCEVTCVGADKEARKHQPWKQQHK